MIKIYNTNVTFFFYLFGSLAKLFSDNEIKYKITKNIDDLSPLNRNNNDLWMISYDCLYDIAVTFKKDLYTYIPDKFIYYHSEAIDSNMKDLRFFNIDYINTILPKAQQVWNYSQLYSTWFNRINIKSIFVPLSYSPFLDLPDKYLNRKKDIDVLCIFGIVSVRRQKCIDILRTNNINVCVPIQHTPRTVIWGYSLDEMVSRSKIILNVYFNDNLTLQPFDFSRLSPLISKKTVIVSEISHDNNIDELFKDKINIVAYDDILSKCKEILANYDKFQSNAFDTYEWFKNNYNLKHFIDVNVLKNYI